MSPYPCRVVSLCQCLLGLGVREVAVRITIMQTSSSPDGTRTSESLGHKVRVFTS